MDREPEPDSSSGGTGRFLFSGVAISGPIEELQATLEKKVRTYESLGEAANAERWVRAHAIAKAKLETAMGSARPPGS